MASKMIGKNVRVVGGRNSGAVGVIESDNAARGQYIIRVSSGKSRGYKISAKYQFVSFSEDTLEHFKNMFEFKHVLVDMGVAKFDVKGLVSLVYEENDQFVANVVFDDSYVVVPLTSLSIIKPFDVKQ